MYSVDNKANEAITSNITMPNRVNIVNCKPNDKRENKTNLHRIMNHKTTHASASNINLSNKINAENYNSNGASRRNSNLYGRMNTVDNTNNDTVASNTSSSTTVNSFNHKANNARGRNSNLPNRINKNNYKANSTSAENAGPSRNNRFGDNHPPRQNVNSSQHQRYENPSRSRNWRQGNEANSGSNQRGPRRGNRNFSRSKERENEHDTLSQKPYENRRRFPYFGFKKFQALLEMDPEKISIEFMSHKEDLKNFFSNDPTSDTMVLIVQVIAKMSESKFYSNLAEAFLNVFSEEFNKKLKNYILNLPIQDANDRYKNRFFWDDINNFFINLNNIFNKMADIIPATANEIALPLVKGVIIILPNIEAEPNILLIDEIKEGFESLKKRLIIIEEEKKEKKAKKIFHDYDDEEEPPDDFRDINIYPNYFEITTPEVGFLRKNKVAGGYRDVNHYLDVQFRLLREDFVAPLRRGICSYLENDGKSGKLSDIKIHRNIQLLQPVIAKNQLGFLIQVINNTKKKPMQKSLENSRRFMFGALLCFTNNNFKSITFGTIVDRDPLRNGQIVVGFDPGVRLETNVDYIMAECKVYFEPYYQVLKALQNIEPEDLPFKQYLVDVDTEVIGSPEYLEPLTRYKINQNTILINSTHWPHYSQLGLNPSQFQAFITGLTKNFSIIQGPPGTGKTYLGLKIAHTLIHNKTAWKGPMLVICFTNHALDQFLEGLLPVTDSIIRIGGQSKSETLNKYNIRSLRLQQRRQRNEFLLMREKERETKIKSREINELNAILQNIIEYKSILKFSLFEDIDDAYDDSWFYNSSSEDILSWLLDGADKSQKLAASEVANQNVDSDEENEFDILSKEILENVVDIDEDIFEINKSSHELISLSALADILIALNNQIKTFKEGSAEYDKFVDQYDMLQHRYKNAQLCLSYLKQEKITEKPRTTNMLNPYNMPPEDRVKLYGYWLEQYRLNIITKINNSDEDYRNSYKEYNELREYYDVQLMKTKLVIGMTTTGAARLQTALQVIKCPIVIVEEAAEVLEAHIITALSANCKHMILIGDHKQLKPSTSDYFLNKDYNLGISLFERMINNNFPCSTLDIQHRMRPEIASLIVPAVYEHLENHESVKNSPDIPGVSVPLYFISHNHREMEDDDGSNSKKNFFEAEYLLKLARYLVLNNVTPAKITILAAYVGQLLLMLRERKKYDILRDVRIVCLDNYQGEENDIILLSLVRNNEKKIGFLYLENRVCVALSRAKHGMFIMGNMNLLCQYSEIWPKVNERLIQMDAIGPALKLCCDKHNIITPITEINDFKKVAEGGCTQTCGELLPCGHTCNRLCHKLPHDKLKCHQPCLKVLCDFNHPCPKQCHEVCGDCLIPKFSELPCGHKMDIPCYMKPEEVICTVKVETKLQCDHVSQKPCYLDPEKAICPYPCDVRVEPCGHACEKLCHIRNDPEHLQYVCKKPCEKMNAKCTMMGDASHKCRLKCYQECPTCNIRVKKFRADCSHVYTLPCHQDVNEFVCEKPCTKTLDCGHKCKQNCNEPCGNCNFKVKKTVSTCGHVVKTECKNEPTRWMCKKKCILKLSCGHQCKLRCCDNCDPKLCMELTSTNILTPCGHALKLPCNLRNETYITNKLLSYCKEKCVKQLQCGHLCAGTCGECFQGRMHLSCQEKCKKILVCGHECSVKCNMMCQPCQLRCTYRCKHNKCTKKCGVPCTTCKEPCVRRCKHQFCTKKCHEKCDIDPCMEPCDQKLKCGHNCIGYCGDPCPPFCKICDKEIVTEILFGTEDEEDARFVYLEDCKHLVEDSGMLQYLSTKTDGAIGMMDCPKCKASIFTTTRYSDQLKDCYKNIELVKKQYYGIPEKIKEDRKKLKKNMKDLSNIITQQAADTMAPKICIAFIQNLSTVVGHRRQNLDEQFLKVYSSKIEIFENICKNYLKYKLKKPNTKKIASEQMDLLISWMISKDVYITIQEIEDYQIELQRFTRIMELCATIDATENYGNILEYEFLVRSLFSFLPYKGDAEVQNQLKALNIKTKRGLNITDEERKAINLSQGHWYKCPNGHVYCIGECGGAMEESKCPECGEKIGGSNHALTAGNRVATEMDGARYSAYSDAHNLANFDPAQFRF